MGTEADIAVQRTIDILEGVTGERVSENDPRTVDDLLIANQGVLNRLFGNRLRAASAIIGIEMNVLKMGELCHNSDPHRIREKPVSFLIKSIRRYFDNGEEPHFTPEIFSEAG